MLPFSVQVDNQSLWEYLLPKQEDIFLKTDPGENAVLQFHTLVYGKQGSGKSQLAYGLYEKLLETYGEGMVEATLCVGNLSTLLKNGINRTGLNRPIQLLVCEDATLRGFSKETLHEFFRVRHLMKERTGLSTGVVFTLVNVHRYHSIPPELRTDVDLHLFKNCPTGFYDRMVIKDYLGPEYLRALEWLQKERKRDRSYLGYTAYNAEGHVGLMYLPKSTLRIDEIEGNNDSNVNSTTNDTDVPLMCILCHRGFLIEGLRLCELCRGLVCKSCREPHSIWHGLGMKSVLKQGTVSSPEGTESSTEEELEDQDYELEDDVDPPGLGGYST